MTVASRRRDRWYTGSHAEFLASGLVRLGLPEPLWGSKSKGQPGELRFARPERQWRFDLAWEEPKVAIEIEGVSTGFSRHQTIGGYREDCRKYSEAAIRGWLVVRVTQDMVESGEAMVLAERAWRARVPA